MAFSNRFTNSLLQHATRADFFTPPEPEPAQQALAPPAALRAQASSIASATVAQFLCASGLALDDLDENDVGQQRPSIALASSISTPRGAATASVDPLAEPAAAIEWSGEDASSSAGAGTDASPSAQRHGRPVPLSLGAIEPASSAPAPATPAAKPRRPPPMTPAPPSADPFPRAGIEHMNPMMLRETAEAAALRYAIRFTHRNSFIRALRNGRLKLAMEKAAALELKPDISSPIQQITRQIDSFALRGGVDENDAMALAALALSASPDGLHTTVHTLKSALKSRAIAKRAQEEHVLALAGLVDSVKARQRALEAQSSQAPRVTPDWLRDVRARALAETAIAEAADVASRAEPLRAAGSLEQPPPDDDGEGGRGVGENVRAATATGADALSPTSRNLPRVLFRSALSEAGGSVTAAVRFAGIAAAARVGVAQWENSIAHDTDSALRASDQLNVSVARGGAGAQAPAQASVQPDGQSTVQLLEQPAMLLESSRALAPFVDGGSSQSVHSSTGVFNRSQPPLGVRAGEALVSAETRYNAVASTVSGAAPKSPRGSGQSISPPRHPAPSSPARGLSSPELIASLLRDSVVLDTADGRYDARAQLPTPPALPSFSTLPTPGAAAASGLHAAAPPKQRVFPSLNALVSQLSSSEGAPPPPLPSRRAPPRPPAATALPRPTPAPSMTQPPTTLLRAPPPPVASDTFTLIDNILQAARAASANAARALEPEQRVKLDLAPPLSAADVSSAKAGVVEVVEQRVIAPRVQLLGAGADENTGAAVVGAASSRVEGGNTIALLALARESRGGAGHKSAARFALA